ncbi:PaaI family thioesterase [Streptomyces sp. NPDC048295]|uniref:PaaI family thioesterase n=1 Tax=Streptomyces sp. NPDC048295 TaxID=3154617 RepID=UPI00343BFC2A
MNDQALQVDPTSVPAGAFLRALGLHLDTVSPHEVRAHLDVTSEHHTPWGITHGGVYATVLESVTSLGASAAAAEHGGYAVGVNNQTDFLRPHREGRLDVLARPVRQGRTLQLWTAEITDTDRRLIARGQVRLFNHLPAN